MTLCLFSCRAAFEPRLQRGLPVFSLKNSEAQTASVYLGRRYSCVTSSYPRLTLDFHTNKRIIDEVVSPAINDRTLIC